MTMLKIEMSGDEKREFANLKMLEDIRNELLTNIRSLDTEIFNFKNRLVDKINRKYSVTLQADYTYDEVNEILLHCLGNEKIIESKVIKLKVPDSYAQVTMAYFNELLKSLSREYTLL